MMHSTILSPVITRWRGLDSAAKFLAYNRWSLQAMVVLFALGSSIGAWPSWALVGIATSTAIALHALHTEPALRLGQPGIRSHPRAFDCLIHAVVLVAGVVSDSFQLALIGVVNILLTCTPFMRRGAVVSCVFAVIVAGVTVAMTGNWLLAVLFLSLATLTPLILWTIRLMLKAHRARFLEAQLRVSEERNRFAQDLHDTLGQNLAAMSIKTQLALKLAQRGDARLTDELAQLHSLIGTTVESMRTVAGSYRSPEPDTELSSATALLEEAGINVEVTGSPDLLRTDIREVAAWFLRETSTNVLRHSFATDVAITLQPNRLSVTNNAPHPATRTGSGLDNLRRRAAAVGGSVQVDRTATSYTTTLELP